MANCIIDEDDSCISCKCCGGELLKIIKEFQDNVEFDRIYNHIDYYPLTMVDYMLNILKLKIIDNGDDE